MDRPSSSKANQIPRNGNIIAQVPYMDSYSTYLSPSEREVRPAIWTSYSSTSARSNTSTDDMSQGRSFSRQMSAPAAPKPGYYGMPPTKLHTLNTKPVIIPAAPRTEPNLPSFVEIRKPRHDATTIPQAPKTEPNLPSFVLPSSSGRPTYLPPAPYARQPAANGKTPDTPADSAIGTLGPTSIYDKAYSTYSVPRSVEHSQVNINCYAAPPAPSHCCCCNQTKEPSRLSRWKSAMKQLFTFKQIDDSDTESIQISHWTDN